MQGRLSKSSSGKIQEFPSTTWKSEFKKANKLGLNKIEWTVDFDNFKSNPIFLKSSQSEVSELTSRFNVGVDSITLDNFVEAPIHKTNEGSGKRSKLSDFVSIVYNYVLDNYILNNYFLFSLKLFIYFLKILILFD